MFYSLGYEKKKKKKKQFNQSQSRKMNECKYKLIINLKANILKLALYVSLVTGNKQPIYVYIHFERRVSLRYKNKKRICHLCRSRKHKLRENEHVTKQPSEQTVDNRIITHMSETNMTLHIMYDITITTLPDRQFKVL